MQTEQSLVATQTELIGTPIQRYAIETHQA